MLETTRPIFIVGSGRSGTSILTWCLGQHPNILPVPETTWINRLSLYLQPIYDVGAARGPRSHLSGMGITSEEFYESFGNAVNDLILRHVPSASAAAGTFARRRSDDDPKRRWLDGTPENSFYVFGLWKMFPAAKFIHIVRDVNDVVRSLMGFAAIGGEMYTEARAYQYWLHSIEACREAEHAFGSETVRRVMYSDLVDCPERFVRRCLEFVGEDYCSDCLKPLQTKINSSNVPPEFDSFEPATDPTLREEAQRVWQEMLRDAETTYEPDQAKIEGLAESFGRHARGMTRQ